jgi:hypothetical protein
MTGLSIKATTLLGYQNYRPILSSAILSVLFIIYILDIGSILGLDVYYLTDRTTHHVFLAPNYAIDPFFDSIIILSLLVLWIVLQIDRILGLSITSIIGILIIVALYTENSLFVLIPAATSVPVLTVAILTSLAFAKSKIRESRYFIAFVSIFLIIIAGISAYMSLSRTTNGPSDINDPFMRIYLTLSYVSPLIMFLIGFSIFLNLLGKPVLNSFRIKKLLTLDISQHETNSNKNKYLILCIAFSIFLVLVPHFNPARELHENVSVDIVYYTRWIAELDDANTLGAFVHTLFIELSGGDRPVSLLLMFILSKISADNITVTLEIIMPIILAPSLVIAVFYLTKELMSNDKIAMFAALLTSMSFQILAGTYSGYYSNWSALIVTYLALTFLLKYLRGGEKKSLLLIYGSLTVVVLFLHTYTWTVLMMFTIAFLTVTSILRIFPRNRLIAISLVIVAVIAFDTIKAYSGIGSGGIGRDLIVVEGTQTGVEQLEIRWDNLVRTVQIYVGGIYGNIFFLSMVFIGTILLFNSARNIPKVFVFTFVSMMILPLFFGNRDVIARMFYDIPFQIPAAVTLVWFQSKGRMGKILVVSTIACLIAAAIRLSTNF